MAVVALNFYPALQVRGALLLSPTLHSVGPGVC